MEKALVQDVQVGQLLDQRGDIGGQEGLISRIQGVCFRAEEAGVGPLLNPHDDGGPVAALGAVEWSHLKVADALMPAKADEVPQLGKAEVIAQGRDKHVHQLGDRALPAVPAVGGRGVDGGEDHVHAPFGSQMDETAQHPDMLDGKHGLVIGGSQAVHMQPAGIDDLLLRQPGVKQIEGDLCRRQFLARLAQDADGHGIVPCLGGLARLDIHP